jgi:hypothetical protein
MPLNARGTGLLVVSAAGLLVGCHTLDGAVKGLNAGPMLLAEAGAANAGQGALGAVVALAVGPIVGAAQGFGEDISDLWFEIEDSTTPGVAWDSAEGVRLRRPLAFSHY